MRAPLRAVAAAGASLGDSLYALPADFDVVDRLNEVAARRGLSSAQIALSWPLRRAGVVPPIVGVTKLRHLEDALAAVGVELEDNETELLDEPYIPHRVLEHD